MSSTQLHQEVSSAVLDPLSNPIWLQLQLQPGTAVLYGLCSLYQLHANSLGTTGYVKQHQKPVKNKSFHC